MRLPNVAKQQSLQQAQAERRILVWQQNKNLLRGGSYFVSKLMDENPPNRGPRKFPICGESEDVRLPNVAGDILCNKHKPNDES